MDATVKDFLSEIDEIAPLTDTKEECVWEKCYDEESGYYYYWNTKTNDVTWNLPSEYKPKPKTKKAHNLYIPPRTAPLFPSTTNLLPPVGDAIKIYKIGESTDTLATSVVSKAVQRPPLKIAEKGDNGGSSRKVERVAGKPKRRRSSSDDERIVLISSYGGDSDSEEDADPNKPTKIELPNGTNKSPNSDRDAADSIIKTQSRTKEEKKSDEVTNQMTTSKTVLISPTTETPPVSGLSLVVGYSDSEEEEEPDSVEPPKADSSAVSHSTLFPIAQHIDIKDFENPKKTQTEDDCVSDGDRDFDAKAFQRKRRIGVALVNTGKKAKQEENETEKKVFSEKSNGINNGPDKYPAFKSGGVMFVKADTLTPAKEDAKDSSDDKLKGIEDAYETLKEKLAFLNEGRGAVSPVQVMLIQLETLHFALKSGDLRQSYLRKWLDDTCADLVKLEKETTPDGWLLQWDRFHKRYCYQNEATGETQWEYPQVDVTRCDEAMDISTTPPPCGAEQTIEMSPPLPPTIRSPTPPPPPSMCDDAKPTKRKKCDIPLPTEPNVASPVPIISERYDANGEPLPPGVDISEENTAENPDLKLALNMFYSEVAAIDTVVPVTPSSATTEETKTVPSPETVQESAKKKKKTKVKLAQGIAMKKKGVSKLVEKWKNVQYSYND